MADTTTDNSGLLGFLGNLLDSAATGYGAGLATTSAIGDGRTPTGQTTNPLATPTGAPGQPGTVPAVATVTPWIPGVSNTTVLLGAGVLGMVALLIAIRK